MEMITLLNGCVSGAKQVLFKHVRTVFVSMCTSYFTVKIKTPGDADVITPCKREVKHTLNMHRTQV